MAPFEGTYTIVITHFVAAGIWQLIASGPQVPYNLEGGVTLETQNEFSTSAFADNNVFFDEPSAVAKALEMIEKTKASTYTLTEI